MTGEISILHFFRLNYSQSSSFLCSLFVFLCHSIAIFLSCLSSIFQSLSFRARIRTCFCRARVTFGSGSTRGAAKCKLDRKLRSTFPLSFFLFSSFFFFSFSSIFSKRRLTSTLIYIEPSFLSFSRYSFLEPSWENELAGIYAWPFSMLMLMPMLMLLVWRFARNMDEYASDVH